MERIAVDLIAHGAEINHELGLAGGDTLLDGTADG
jgi:hypothetical protein